MRRERIAFLLLWGMAIPIRLLWLEAKCIHTDEMDILLSAQSSLRDLLAWCAQGNWPPLFHLLVKFSLSVKETDAALRFPAAAAAVLALPATYFALGKLFKSPVPLLVCVLLTWSPYQIHYDRTAKMYPLLILLSMLSLLFLHESIHRGRWWRWLLFSLTQAAGLYTSYFAIPLFAGLALYGIVSLVAGEIEGRSVSWSPRDLLSRCKETATKAWTGPRGFKERQLFFLFLSCVLVVVFYLPWLNIAVRCLARNIGEEGRIAFSHYAKSSGSLLFFFFYIMAVFGSGGSVALESPLSPFYWTGGLLWLVPACFGLVLTMRRSVAIPVLIVTVVGGPFLLLWALEPTTSSYPRFLMTAMPFLFALACQGAVAGISWLRERRPIAAKISSLLLVLWVACLWSETHYALIEGDAASWKPAAAYLRERLEEGDLLIGGRYNGAPILTHYLPEWRDRVRIVPYWAYELWYEQYDSCRERGLPSHMERQHVGQTVWFVTAAERDVPEEIWRAVRSHFSEEAVFPSRIRSGKVLIYSREIEEGSSDSSGRREQRARQDPFS